MGQVVLHGDGLLGAGLGALHAADAARSAGLAGVAALVLVLAQDNRLALVLGNDGDDGVGAHRSARAAAHALGPVHLGDAVHNVDGIEGAGLHAVAIAQTAELAHAVAAVQALYGLAAVDALKLELLAGLFTGAGAAHHGLHGHGGAGLHAHDLGDGGGGLGPAGDALVHRCALLHHALGVVGAAGAAAGAAVGAGQSGGDLLHPLVHGHIHEDRGGHQDHRAYQADDGDNDNCH